MEHAPMGSNRRRGMNAMAAWAAALALTALLELATDCPLRADDFRIQTKVFANGDKEPVSENTTLFCRGLVYDFIDDPAEVVVFDPPGGRFVLLEPQRKERAEISLSQLDTLSTSLKQKLSERPDALAKFLVSPAFRTQTSEAGEVSFVAPWAHYQVRATPAP